MSTASADDSVSFSVRPLRSGDEAFTYSSFLSWCRESEASAGIFDRNFYPVMKDQWASVLRTFDVLVAHPRGDEEEIAGYLAHKAGVIAFVYVKRSPWRQMGVATLLLREAGFDKGRPVAAMFASQRSLELARAKGWNITVLPGALQAVRALLGVA